MVTVSLTRATVKDLLFAESTNVSRTYKRNDGVSDFEEIVIDTQANKTLDGAWNEAYAKLAEKMHDFLSSSTIVPSQATFVFTATALPDGIQENIKMFFTDWMMADWLASVRPDFRQRYIDRSNIQLNDLLRKLYKKEPPV